MMKDTKSFTSGAKKDLTGKLPYHLIPKEGMDALAEGLNCGILKGYPARNWELGLPYMEAHVAAALRHIFKFASGEDINEETAPDGSIIKTNHIDNALSHIMMLAVQIRRGRSDLDDRPKVNKCNKNDMFNDDLSGTPSHYRHIEIRTAINSAGQIQRQDVRSRRTPHHFFRDML